MDMLTIAGTARDSPYNERAHAVASHQKKSRKKLLRLRFGKDPPLG